MASVTSNHQRTGENSLEVSSAVDTPFSASASSLDEIGMSGSVRMSEACADAMGRSKGTFGRPRKGILSEKRLADGFKGERFWLESVDNITRGETDSNDGPADGNFGTCSSIDDGVRGEPTPACEPTNGETGRSSDSGDLDCIDETGENHLRAGMGTGAVVSDGASPSTLASSGLGGVGGMMFVTGRCGVSEAGGSIRAVSIAGRDDSSASRSLLDCLEDEDEANQVRFLGTILVATSGWFAFSVRGSEIDGSAGTESASSSGGGMVSDVLE
ncbi:hypothetical protein BC827DRAFT_929319 [Russula dissimulans]|nr:hypothetical protein BC827DRAFT_929319 [Russula dissimulans]